MIDPSKAKDEGAFEDIKVVLGWEYNTRTLCVSLHNPKFISWTKTIQEILSKDETKSNNQETLIGRLNHTAFIMILARHFLAIIRFFHSKINAFASYRLWTKICDDLKLYMGILQKARKVIPTNLLTYLEPARIYLTGACKIGIGGFGSKGRAQRWQIPKEYWGCAHINLLLSCAELVLIWIDKVEDTLYDKECLLSMGDSTTAIGSLQKARKTVPKEHPQLTLRKNETPKKTGRPDH